MGAISSDQNSFIFIRRKPEKTLLYFILVSVIGLSLSLNPWVSQFDCNWDRVKSELEKKGLLTDVLRLDVDSGPKLVSCGQTSDGNRIVLQWIKSSDADSIDCAPTRKFTTGCYTLYPVKDVKQAAATTKEEKSKQVYACMNQL